MVQKSRHYLYLGLGIVCLVIGTAFLTADNLFGLLLFGMSLGIIFLAVVGLMKIKFMNLCAKAFAEEDFRPDKMIYSGSHFFLCDTEHHKVGYIRLDKWLQYIGGEKDLKNELNNFFHLMDSDAITMLRKEENRVKIMFRGLKPINISFLEKESATELYYTLVKVRNENSSFQESPDRYWSEDEDLTSLSEDEDDWDEEDDLDEDETDPSEEDSDTTEPMGPSAPEWRPPFSVPNWMDIFDYENKKDLNADQVDENTRKADPIKTPDLKAVESATAEHCRQAEDDGTTAPESRTEATDQGEEIGTESTQVAFEKGTEPAQKSTPDEPNSPSVSDDKKSLSAEKPRFEGFMPEAQQSQPAVSSMPYTFGQTVNQPANEESTLVCPRCGSANLSGETVVTCRNCGHQFFR